MTPWQVAPFGDAALLVDLGWRGPGDGNETAQRFAQAVRAIAPGGEAFGDPVPGLASVLVPFDPDRLGLEAAIQWLSSITIDDTAEMPATGGERAIELPVRYGAADGPDLEDVARHVGLSRTEVIELHSSVEYRVLFLGFAPGFAYLGDLPMALSIPRLTTPRKRVAAGSVGIAGRHTAAYPFESPGGWRLIGRTEATLWDASRLSPALLVPGSKVRFVPVGPG